MLLNRFSNDLLSHTNCGASRRLATAQRRHNSRRCFTIRSRDRTVLVDRGYRRSGVTGFSNDTRQGNIRKNGCFVFICQNFATISAKDLDLIHVVDTADEAVAIMDNFYSNYLLKPNF